MITCESCRHMRGIMRLLRGRFDYRSYYCSCSRGILWNDYKKAPKTFQLGSRSTSKNVIYEGWGMAEKCMEYDSMDS